MREPDFEATGVRITRLLRSLTRAGQVRVSEGRLVLLTSYDREIDSAPVREVQVRRPWYVPGNRALASLNGSHYLLRLPAAGPDGLLAAVGNARRRSPGAPSGGAAGRAGTVRRIGAAEVTVERRTAHP